jgi:hypothetical protein
VRRRAYQLTAEPRSIYACHCRDCQRETSGPYSIGILAWQEHFVLADGTAETVTFHKTAESGRIVAQHLCATCITRVWHDPAGDPSIVVIRAATLDDSSWVEPHPDLDWIEIALRPAGRAAAGL